MYGETMEIRRINLNRNNERQEVNNFLINQGLLLENDVDYTIAVYKNDDIIGTGSLSGNVLKCIAIDSDYQGESISNKIVSFLITEQFNRGNTHLFIFTKPKYKDLFIDLGFSEIISVDGKVSLLENDPRGITKYVEMLKSQKIKGSIVSSIVMNCNPFTLGHQYLVEEASKNSDIVHLFVVWEDKSIFSKDVRLKLVKEGTKHLKNVFIHLGKDYIISNSTFPSYFIKEKNSVVNIHAMLDLKIFGEFIAPSLGINRRYIGEEPNDPVTYEYNFEMKKILPQYNIDVVEIPRLVKKGLVISASEVRKAIKLNKIELLKQLVPLTTYEYLLSIDTKSVIEKIKSN
nr:[citrate (pro-3S)-lyase] ligase [Sedimentibacter sp.]